MLHASATCCYMFFLMQDQYKMMASSLADSPVSSGGINTRCSTLAAEGAVLMGDAGHSMWPSLGQGANAALESAAVLGNVLEDCKVSCPLSPCHRGPLHLKGGGESCRPWEKKLDAVLLFHILSPVLHPRSPSH